MNLKVNGQPCGLETHDERRHRGRRVQTGTRRPDQRGSQTAAVESEIQTKAEAQTEEFIETTIEKNETQKINPPASNQA